MKIDSVGNNSGLQHLAGQEYLIEELQGWVAQANVKKEIEETRRRNPPYYHIASIVIGILLLPLITVPVLNYFLGLPVPFDEQMHNACYTIPLAELEVLTISLLLIGFYLAVNFYLFWKK